jgi:hypothetical protein
MPQESASGDQPGSNEHGASSIDNYSSSHDRAPEHSAHDHDSAPNRPAAAHGSAAHGSTADGPASYGPPANDSSTHRAAAGLRPAQGGPRY